MKKHITLAVLAVVVASSLYGCVMPMMPSASATLISSDTRKVAEAVVPVGPVITEKECSYWWLILVTSGNLQPSHERLIGKILGQAKADILLDADLSLTTRGIPYLFLMTCAEVSGQPARLVAEKEVEK